jgi:hypothetical protein
MSSMEYLNEIDRIVPSVDVNDDYLSEKKEVQAAQGANYAFSFGDYVVKTLLGPIDPAFDNLDEVRHQRAAAVYTTGSVSQDAMDACCNIM